MFPKKSFTKILFLAVLVVSGGLCGCKNTVTPATATAVATTVIEQTAAKPTTTVTPTPFNPSATPQPLAARINGTEISLAEYEVELARFRGAWEDGQANLNPDTVIEELIHQVLLAQGAERLGFSVSDALIAERLNQLGVSEQQRSDWMTTQGYTPESLNAALKKAIAAAWMRDEIISAVPNTAEQVHARQFLLYNAEDANEIYAQLQSGTNFGTLVEEYEPLTKGDLGWFPRGYLTVPELDDVIFSLQPDEYSPITQTELGYHIIQVIAIEPNRPLSSSALQAMQRQAIAKWLQSEWDKSNIEILVP